MLDVTPGQSEDSEQLCGAVSLNFSREDGDFDSETLCPGGDWGFPLGYGDVDPD